MVAFVSVEGQRNNDFDVVVVVRIVRQKRRVCLHGPGTTDVLCPSEGVFKVFLNGVVVSGDDGDNLRLLIERVETFVSAVDDLDCAGHDLEGSWTHCCSSA